MKASAGMPRRRKRTQYQQVSAFERGKMVGLREASLSCRDIAARTGHAATTVVRVWNQWREEGHPLRRAGTGPRNMTTTRDVRMSVTFARHVVHRTCLGYGWSATYSSVSSSTYSVFYINFK